MDAVLKDFIGQVLPLRDVETEMTEKSGRAGEEATQLTACRRDSAISALTNNRPMPRPFDSGETAMERISARCIP